MSSCLLVKPDHLFQPYTQARCGVVLQVGWPGHRQTAARGWEQVQRWASREGQANGRPWCPTMSDSCFFEYTKSSFFRDVTRMYGFRY